MKVVEGLNQHQNGDRKKKKKQKKQKNPF